MLLKKYTYYCILKRVITLYYINYSYNNQKNKKTGKEHYIKWYHVTIMVFLIVFAVAALFFLILLKKNVNKNPELLQNKNQKEYTNVFSESYETYIMPMYSYSLKIHVDGLDNYYLPDILKNVYGNREFNLTGTLGPYGGRLTCYSSDPEFRTEVIVNTDGTYLCPKYFGEEIAIDNPSEESYSKAAACFEKYKNSYIRVSDGFTKNLIDSYICGFDLPEVEQKSENDYCSMIIPDKLVNRNDNFVYAFISDYPGDLNITLRKTSDEAFSKVFIEGKGQMNFTIELDECPYFIKEPQVESEDIIEKVEF